MTPLLLYTIYYIRHNEKIAHQIPSTLIFPLPGVVHQEGLFTPPSVRVINIRKSARIPVSSPAKLQFLSRKLPGQKVRFSIPDPGK